MKLRSTITIATIILASLVTWYFSTSEQRAREDHFPRPAGDGCRDLDAALGSRSRDRGALLAALAGEGLPPVLPPPAPDLRHQALRRLLDVQTRQIAPATGGTGIDHTVVEILQRSSESWRVMGTASLTPDSFDSRPWEGYWSLETFEFTADGTLVSRTPYAAN